MFDQILDPLSVNFLTIEEVIRQTEAKDRSTWDVGQSGGWERRRLKRNLPGQSGKRTGVNIMQHKVAGLRASPPLQCLPPRAAACYLLRLFVVTMGFNVPFTDRKHGRP